MKRQRMWRHWLGVALAVALLTAAAPGRDYDRAYRGHTKTLKIYRGFSTALILRGTLLTEDFRVRLAAERKRLLNATAENHSRFVQRMNDDAGAYHEVVFSADSPEIDSHRFGTSDDGWVLRLEADGVDQELVTVYRVRQPTMLHKSLYDHLNQWSELWIARFARTVERPNEVVMYVGSGFGNGELRWDAISAE